MANRRSGKLWTPGLLKKPGMDQGTYGTASSPSPIPPFQRSPVPHWHRDDVRAAEATAAFQAKSRGPCPGAPTPGRRGCGPAAARPFGPGLAGCPREETWPWVLAGYYHQAIVSHLPAAARGRGLRSNQISGFLNQFLSLGTRCDEAQLPGGAHPLRPSGRLAGDHPDAPWPGWSRPSIRGSPGRRGNRSSAASPPPSRRPICRRCCR